jgi:hypothetical protein
MFRHLVIGPAMAQVVSRRSFITKARVRLPVSPCGFCGGQTGNGTGFFQVLRVLPSISFHRGYILIYLLGDEQQARWWPQFRDIISPHWHGQQREPTPKNAKTRYGK